jgi:hypothetical protein
MARDISTYGMVAIRVDAPPKVDEPTVWSIYPNGLDPALVTTARGDGGWVARTRPRERDRGSPKIIEIGQVTAEGAFRSRQTLDAAGDITHVDVAEDPAGGVSVSWVDSAGSWLERVVCP